MKYIFHSFLAVLIVTFIPCPVFADEQSSKEITAVNSTQQSLKDELNVEAVEQLRDIQSSLDAKISERRSLRLKLKQSSEAQQEQLKAELESLAIDIELLEKTFEQIAIGGIDLSVFGVEEGKFNWREELLTIVKPLIENVKSLTEKPRKIENLRRVISDKEAALQASLEAISSVKQLLNEADSKTVSQKLAAVQQDWENRRVDLEREIQLASYQLDSLEGKDISWMEILKQNLSDFASGRGLTLVFSFAAAFAVLGLMKTFLWLIRKRTKQSSGNSVKTRYRLAAYGYRLLTGILIAVAVMLVLYFRQDLLLLAVMVVVFIGLALALKNLLPKYITEGRILLNVGGIRERERIVYNGIPWKVNSINVNSRFVNPEIQGSIRIPISHMHDMISRPYNNEPWFPSSEGDWVLGEDGNPEQVIKQTIDVVELRDLNSISYTMPTAEYYERGFPNISRADAFRISVSFGIDYATQTVSPSVIENAFKEGIEVSFKDTEIEPHVIAIDADFHSAGDSSLNYLMLAKFDTQAAQYYNKIKRRIQRACVMVCNEHGWGIPFPQLTVHQANVSDDKAGEFDDIKKSNS